MTIQHVAVLPEVVDLLNRLSDNETLSAMRATE
jgi:hypothetical protein